MKILKNPEHLALDQTPVEKEKKAWATPDVILLEDLDIGFGLPPSAGEVTVAAS